MSSEGIVLTKTDRNLWSAIIGEAMAYLKYAAYAHKALEEGHPEIAQIFQEVAGAETIHGLNHLRVAGEIKPTAENLRAVNIGESKEFSTMYPRMIQEAMVEDRQEAADSFRLAMDRERHHQEMFDRALKQLEAKLASHPAPTAPPPVERAGVAGAEAIPAAVPFHVEPAPGGDFSESRFSLDQYVAAAAEVDRERWRVASFGRLREVVFGAQDGILSTVALATSVAVAIEDKTTVLVAALAGALAGMISMATGAYLGSRAEQDVRHAEIARESKELEENPAQELAELVVIYQREGKSFAEAQHLAEQISSDKDLWLRTLVEKELGISPVETGNPIKDALTMGVAFVLAAFIPILPYFFVKGNPAITISVAGSLVGLFALGLWKGRLVQKAPLLQGVEILLVGAASAGVGFALGDVIPRLVS